MTGMRHDSTVTAAPIKALIIKPDATYEVRQIDQSLASYREILGGYLEAVPAGEGATFWCNEEGKIHGLPRNNMATYLWWKLDPEFEGLDDLCGTVVVTGPADEAGDSYPVLDAVVDLYRRMEAIRMDKEAKDVAEGPENGAEPVL